MMLIFISKKVILNYTFHTKLCFIFKFGAYNAKLSKEQTPPISGHFALAPTVSADWREYCKNFL